MSAAKEAAELTLGCHALVCMDVAPEIELTPEPAELTIDQLETASVPAGGTCKNLVDELECSLEWRFKTDVFGEEIRTKLHPRATVLVPDGGRFKVLEAGKKPLALSAFDINLVGEGRLAWSVTPRILGARQAELPLEKTKLAVKLPIKLSPSPSRGLMGTKVALTVEGAACFNACIVQATISDSGFQAGHTMGVEREWKPDDLSAKAVRRWWVGRAVDEDTASGAARFCYRGDQNSHVFTQHLKIMEARKGGRTIDVPERPLFEAPHPRLESFKLALEGKLLQAPHRIVVEGKLSGFTDELVFPLNVNLFVHGTGPGWPRPLWACVNDPWGCDPVAKLCVAPPAWADANLVCSNAEPKGLVEVAGSRFHAELFDFGAVSQEVVDRLKATDVVIFAELEFPVGSAVSSGGSRPVFATLAGYGAAMAEKKPEDWTERAAAVLSELFMKGKQFAPFSAGRFSWPEVATGVCSNLVDLKGQSMELRAPGPDVKPDERDEYIKFMATVAGESLDTPAAWKGVAASILNRVGRYDWGVHGFKTVTQVVENTGYVAYSDRARNQPYQDAEAYLMGRPVPRQGNLDALREMIPRVKPLFLGMEGDTTDVTFFYNPQAAARAAMGRDQDKLEDCTAQVLGSSADARARTKFVFLRYKERAPPFNRRG